MVTTSAASPPAARSLLIDDLTDELIDDGVAARVADSDGRPAALPLACTILTPSGALLARALVRPRPAALPAETYAVEVSQVEPRGALEPLLRSNPQVVLRTPQAAQLAMRIDHIIGPREARTYFLQTLEPPVR